MENKRKILHSVALPTEVDYDEVLDSVVASLKVSQNG